MKAYFGGIIVAGSGAVGNYVVARNRYGSYVRAKAPDPLSGSIWWEPIRDQTEFLAANWSAITQANRQAWEHEARLHPRTDLWGRYHTLPGYNYYISVNINRWFCGVADTDAPPAYVAPGYFTQLSLQFTTLPDALTVSYSPALAADTKVKVWSCKPLSLGRSFIGTEYRLIGTYAGSPGNTIEFFSDYFTRFAVNPDAGHNTYVKASQVHIYSGDESLSLQALCTF
jgi:hypothetical protein